MSLRLTPLAVVLSAAAVFAADPPEPKFRAVTIDDKIQIGYGVAVADVDGDGKPDVLLADKKQFVWYRNPTWEKFVLAENLTEKDNVCLAAQDLDGDGKCEIAVGAEWNPADTEKSGAVFYLIPPADRTQRWEPVKFPSVEPTTHRMKWIKLDDRENHRDTESTERKDKAAAASPSVPSVSSVVKNEWGLVVVPLHGRGNKNGEGAPVKVLCYVKPADPRAGWKAEVVDESMHMTHNFDVVRTGGIRVIGKEGVTVILKARAGDKAGQWVSIPMSSHADAGWAFVAENGGGELRGGKLPGAGLVATVEPMHGNALVAYVSTTQSPARRRHVLNDKLVEGHALACGDVLNSGGDQIVVGWRGKPGQTDSTTGVSVWSPLDPEGGKWRETVVDPDGMACEDLVLADLNADGKLDIVTSGRATKNVKIYLNETPR